MLLRALSAGLALAGACLASSTSSYSDNTPTTSNYENTGYTDAPTVADYYNSSYMPYDDYLTLHPELKTCSTSNIRVTYMEDESPPFSNCTFPFLYNDVVYYECTNVDYAGRYWCANDCSFSSTDYNLRGLCDPRDLPPEASGQGILGTGVALNTLNVFVGLIMTVSAFLFVGLLIGEFWRRKNFARVGDDSSFSVPGFEMAAPTTAGQRHDQQRNNFV